MSGESPEAAEARDRWPLIYSGILHLAYAWQAGRPGAADAALAFYLVRGRAESVLSFQLR